MNSSKTQRWTVDVSRDTRRQEWKVSVSLSVSPDAAAAVKVVDDRPIRDISAAIGESALAALEKLSPDFVKKIF